LNGNPGDAIVLNFTNVPIEDAARAILGEILDLNYAIDPQATGVLNFKTSKPILRSKLLGLFQDLLSRQRLVISEQEDVFYITTIQNSLKSGGQLPPGTKSIKDTTISPIPLQYVSASQLTTVLSPVVSEYATLQADEARNMLLVKSDVKHLSTIYDLIQIFDVDWMAGLSFAMYPLSQTTPKNMIKNLQDIFKNGKGGVLSDLVEFIPVERLNSVLVVTKNPQYLIKIATWIEQLDRGEEGSMGLYVYKLTHARSDMVADVLGNIFGANVPNHSTDKASKIEPSSDSESTVKDIKKSYNTITTNSTSTKKNPPSNLQKKQKTIKAGNISIYPDVRNNSVVIRASPSDYKMVEVALQKLDIPPLQVMIEATIAQVTLGDDFELGLKWFFGREASKGRVNLDGSTTTSTGDALSSSSGTSSVFSYVLTKSNLGVTLSALQTLTDVKVVSSPHVMVLNNESASLNSGSEVPITKQITTSITTDGTPVSTDIEYRKLGVNLDVTPHVTSSGMVNLKITQSINSVASASDSTTPTINNQSIDTMVSLKSGDTIALGGLISDTETKGKSGVPYLRDVPLLGNLFSQQRNTKTRQELLILLTPHIIEATEQAELVTNELKYKMAMSTKFTQDVNKFYTEQGGRVQVGFIDGPQPHDNPAKYIEDTDWLHPKNKITNEVKPASTKENTKKQPTNLLPVEKTKPIKTIVKGEATKMSPVSQPSSLSTKKQPVTVASKALRPVITRGNGTDYVQLSALKDNMSALKEWRIVKAKYPDTLGKLSPVIKEYQAPSGNQYFRLQAGPISKTDALSLCNYLKTQKQSCLLVK